MPLKIVNPKTHGVMDYALAIAFLVMPALFDFSDGAATLSYIIGVAYLGASLLTRYPLGAIKLIPFPVHGVLESIMAAAWIVMPWLFGFADDAAARNFFVIAGIGLLGLASCTNYSSEDQTAGYVGEERRQRTVDRRQHGMPVGQERRGGLGDRRGMAA